MQIIGDVVVLRAKVTHQLFLRQGRRRHDPSIPSYKDIRRFLTAFLLMGRVNLHASTVDRDLSPLP